MSTSPVRLRQIALVAKDLKRAEFLLTKVLGSEVIFRDPAVAIWGLENILVPIGGDVIEVISPTRGGTTAGRLLSKRGDGGYLIIMQSADAAARRSYLESKGLANVIFSHEEEDSICIQYHPKGISGGVIPELDSHKTTPSNPNPIAYRFSPWHPCGKNFDSYSAGMRRHSDLQLVSVTCRLRPGVSDVEGAAKQWEDLFGVERSRNESSLAFTNMKMSFAGGCKGKPEGLETVTIAVAGKQRLDGIWDRASKEGLCGDGWINMLGLKWYFEPVETFTGLSKL